MTFNISTVQVHHNMLKMNKRGRTCRAWPPVWGINPYTLTVRFGSGDLAHYEMSLRLDPTARSFAQGNKTWRSSRILVG